MVTGFRVATGGMQSLLGVRPDLSMFGKVMAGGLPGGALGGRRELMELLASRIEHPGHLQRQPAHRRGGHRHPRHLRERRTAGGGVGDGDAARDRMARGDAAGAASTGACGGWRASSTCASPTPPLQAGLAGRMREEGVDLLHTSAFCSAVHTDEDVAASVAALDRALTA